MGLVAALEQESGSLLLGRLRGFRQSLGRAPAEETGTVRGTREKAGLFEELAEETSGCGST